MAVTGRVRGLFRFVPLSWLMGKTAYKTITINQIPQTFLRLAQSLP